MSNYTFKAKNKETGVIVDVVVLDNYCAFEHPNKCGYKPSDNELTLTQTAFDRMYEETTDHDHPTIEEHVQCKECAQRACDQTTKDMNKLDQKIIDAYEEYMLNVDEAVDVVSGKSGSRFAGNMSSLKLLLERHKKNCYDTIEKALFPDNK